MRVPTTYQVDGQQETVFDITQHFPHWFGSRFVDFTFLPQYLHQHLRLDMAATGLVAALPMVASGLGLVVAGVANDALLHRGWALRNVRRGFNTVRMHLLCLSLCVPSLTRLRGVNRRRGCCRRAASSL